jgi:integrase
VAKIELSDAKLRSLPLPAKGQASYWDSKLPGFGVRISQGGSKTFILKRQNAFITIGRFGVVTLSEARTEAKRLLAEYTLGKVRPQSATYEQAVKSFIEEKRKSRRSSTADAYEGLLKRLNFSGQVAQLSHEDVQRKLGKYKTAGAYNHYLVAARVFFNWCIKRRYRTDNPTLGLSKHKRPKKKRILSDDELLTVWHATYSLETDFGEIVRLLIVLGQRRNEIASLRDGYYSDNAQLLIIPAEVTKNGHSHALPVGPIAAGILSKRIRKERHTDLLFEGGKTGNPFSAWSKNKKLLDKLAPIAPWTLHDLRRTLRTGLGKLGVRPDIAERVLNHISARTEVEDVYDLNLYLPEMRDAMERWQGYITSLLEQQRIAA